MRAVLRTIQTDNGEIQYCEHVKRVLIENAVYEKNMQYVIIKGGDTYTITCENCSPVTHFKVKETNDE